MVKAWREPVCIPTYEVGKPEKNPIFLENRVYQGSSGVVYPYPVIESIEDEPTPHNYDAIYIENEYIKVMILPELGGRVQMAYDKVKERHFIYYNHVVKPALVGLAGPWISGGIEFNWPQHHRPSTFMPVDCKIEEHEDGSVTVWVNERERMFHQQGQAGFTLRPGCAYLEIQGKLYNPTEVPQTFLWWANPAVAVNDAYQSVFPPDVNAVFDHGKRAVSTFPIATGTYYKMDYSAGVDISNYKNIKVPTSYMVAKSKYNFEGGYENDTHGGMLHVADHHISPGKKQWTWGNGDFGRAWDRNLTDEDGPYIELMAGVYTENQPDFTWLMPYEEKSFVQYFMPYRELGVVKNANRDIMLNITPSSTHGKALLQIYATSMQQVEIHVRATDGTSLFDTKTSISPEQVFAEEIDMMSYSLQDISIQIQGTTSLSWQAEPDDIQPTPEAARAALLPADIKTTEELYLTGLHLEQYRHATWSATDYYREALRREPNDIRCNNALGLWYLKRGALDKAEQHFRTAVKALQKYNPNPYDGEPLYNLALALKYQGKYDEAYDWFYKSTWNKAWQDAGYMACAQISVLRHRYEDALHEIDHALIYGWHNHKARALKAHILSHLPSVSDSERVSWANDSLLLNPFNYGILLESGRTQEMVELMRSDSNNYDELALDYVATGAYDMAMRVWEIAVEQSATSPMTNYYLAWVAGLLGKDSATYYKLALADTPYFANPNRIEAQQALLYAVDHQTESDYRPAFMLGCFYYDKRLHDEAYRWWKEAEAKDVTHQCPAIQRNIALYLYNKAHDAEGALQYMRSAFEYDTTDARIFMEYDQLLKKLDTPSDTRLALYEKYGQLVSQRDDLVLEHATILNALKRHEEAKDMIDQHIFHPWEGGEGKVSGQYQLCRLEMAKRDLTRPEAITLLQECLTFPHNLGEGKLYGAQDNDFYYYLGEAYRLQGNDEKAREMWTLGIEGPTEPAAALYYNDAKPEKIHYAALCYHALGMEEKARGLAFRLINYGRQHYHDHITMDYFAVSLPDLLVWDEDLDVRNRRHCLKMISLGEEILNK